MDLDGSQAGAREQERRNEPSFAAEFPRTAILSRSAAVVYRAALSGSSGESSMLGRSFSLVVVMMLGGLVMGCSPEAKAKRALETYETVFRSCKEQTEKASMKPGDHPCSGIASSALDLGLQQTGIDESKKQELLTKWLEQKKFVGYYVPSEKRPK